MKSSFKLDSNNNIIHNRNITLISNEEALVQDIKNRLYMYKGEYPFNINEGIDYINYVRENNETGLLNAIIKRILEDTRISNVSFEKGRTKDNLKIILTITTGMEVALELD